ncbi:MAG: hypothetical protein K8H88_00095 [Sandaracinaceae bacterium]|nr:hypothetical protein [Sandaracinaceae bacterium]
MAEDQTQAPIPPEDWEAAEPFHDSFVVPYEDLAVDQKRAFGAALTWLWGLGKQPWTRSKPEPQLSPRMDELRLANAFLIDGPRGSGKTMALVKLLDFLERQSPFRQDARREADKELASLAEKVRSQAALVSLPMLDLKPFPQRPLILDLAAGWLRVLGWLDEDAPRLARDALPAGLPPEHSARQAWSRFARSAALGFARLPRKDLEPADYVAEMVQATEQWGAVSEAFSNLVDELVCGCERRGARRPVLFILPIDDADMHPTRTIELLDFLRFLRHPRLAYVVTGDSQLFLDALQTEHQPKTDRVPFPLRVQPADLAAQALHKVFPRPQRLRLKPLTLAERYRILDARLKGSETEGEAIDELKDRLRRASYVLCAALGERLRDLHQQVTHLDLLAEVLPLDAAVVRSVRGWWEEALDASELPSEDRRALRAAIEVIQGPDRRFNVAEGDERTRLEPSQLAFGIRLRFARSISTSLRVSWGLYFQAVWGDRPLSEHASAAYALAAAYATEESAHRALVSAAALPFVTNVIERKPVAWPLPELSSFDQRNRSGPRETWIISNT